MSSRSSFSSSIDSSASKGFSIRKSNGQTVNLLNDEMAATHNNESVRLQGMTNAVPGTAQLIISQQMTYPLSMPARNNSGIVPQRAQFHPYRSLTIPPPVQMPQQSSVSQQVPLYGIVSTQNTSATSHPPIVAAALASLTRSSSTPFVTASATETSNATKSTMMSPESDLGTEEEHLASTLLAFASSTASQQSYLPSMAYQDSTQVQQPLSIGRPRKTRGLPTPDSDTSESKHSALSSRSNGEPKTALGRPVKHSNYEIDDSKGRDKRFKCPHPGCNSRFSNRGHVERHMRVHTGEKPFKCLLAECPKRFSRRKFTISDTSVQ